MISISLSPNTELDDVWIAIKSISTSWMWKRGESIQEVENWFKRKFNSSSVYSFSSGRTSLFAILKAYSISSNDEVIVQAFTCVAVPEVVMWVGAKPVYADIDETYNIDSTKLESYISKKTKAIIVQHTFGIPAEIIKIKHIAEKHNLILIEDCAHALGATFDGKLLGSFGDAVFFSFGRDKVVSSVFGGIAIINEKSKMNNEKELFRMKTFYDALSFPPYFWIIQQLLHPIVLNLLVIPFYNVLYSGKVILVLFQKLNLLSFPVAQCEYQAKMPDGFITKYPNGLAKLLINQLPKLERYNSKRRRIAKQYQVASNGNSVIEGAIYLRYPLQLRSRNIMVKIAKKRNIQLGNWYHSLIDPADCQLQMVGYHRGSCPNAERLAKGIVNLPTHPRMKDREVLKVLNFIKNYS